MRWRSLPLGVRVVAVLATSVVAVNLLIGAIDAATRGADEAGVDSDPGSTAANGTAAWMELLDRNGIEVRRAERPDVLGEPGAALVILDPEDASPRDARRIADAVSGGAQLVVVGEGAASVLDLMLDRPPQWSPVGSDEAEAVGTAPEVDGVSQVRAAGEGSWADLGASDPLLQGDRRVVAATAAVGAGRIVLLADPSIVQNAFLGDADNAVFALRIVGQARSVVVAEPAVSSGETGLAAIPARWKLALAGLVVAFLVGAVAAGRRIGPPDPPASQRQPPRRTFVDAIGLALERTRRPEVSLEPLRARARAQLAERAGLATDVGDDDLRAAAARLGWPPDEIAAVLAPVTHDRALVAGRALARSSTLRRDPPHPHPSDTSPAPEGKRAQE